MFNVEKVTNDIIDFIKTHFKKNNLDGIVMGVSGGKDSTIVSALFVRALGKENIIGVTIPCHSIKSDESDAKRVADFLGFKLYNLDISKTYDTFEDTLTTELEINDVDVLREPNINLKPRLRMSVLYYFAQALSLKTKKTYIVAGTSNKCEITIGYFTKWGDGASDINILADLMVSEVLAIGDYLGLPQDLVHKTPADGLSGKSDEEKLGFPYSEVEDYLNGKNTNPKIVNMNKFSAHKRKPITIFKQEDIVSHLISKLLEKGKTISTMESCTAGLLASTITNIDGSSKVIAYSAVTYSDEYKIKMGVSADAIKEHTVYSEEVAIEMAKAITLYTSSDYGVGITGLLGETTPEFPFNFAYVALYNATKKEIHAFKVEVNEGIKNTNKEIIVDETLKELIKFI